MSALIAGTAAVLYIMPFPGAEKESHGAAVILALFGLWLVRALPDYLAAILFFAAVPALGIAPAGVVFSAFQLGGLWLVLAGFIIGKTIETTGLGARTAGIISRIVGRSYSALVISATVTGAVLVFVTPSAIARVFMLVPIFGALADRLGFERGSNGRTGLILASTLGTLIPAYAVLPSTIPNLVMQGTAEKLYGSGFGYAEYLVANFPVLAVFVIVMLPILIRYLFPAKSSQQSVPIPVASPSRQEVILFGIIICGLALWATDFLHGVQPAWIGLGIAALCLAPRLGPGKELAFSSSVNLALWLFIAAVIGAGAVINHVGLSDMIGRELVDWAGLSQGQDFRNYFAVVFVGMGALVVATTLGAPAIMTPLAQSITEATGFPLQTVLLLQVPGWMFFPFVYQLPALLPVLALGGITVKQCSLLLIALTVVGVFIALPLQCAWLNLMGYF